MTKIFKTPQTVIALNVDPRQAETSSVGLGLQLVEINTGHLDPNQTLHFNIQYNGESRPQSDYTVTVKEQERA